eukprot:UN02350
MFGSSFVKIASEYIFVRICKKYKSATSKKSLCELQQFTKSMESTYLQTLGKHQKWKAPAILKEVLRS